MPFFHQIILDLQTYPYHHRCCPSFRMQQAPRFFIFGYLLDHQLPYQRYFHYSSQILDVQIDYARLGQRVKAGSPAYLSQILAPVHSIKRCKIGAILKIIQTATWPPPHRRCRACPYRPSARASRKDTIIHRALCTRTHIIAYKAGFLHHLGLDFRAAMP